MTQSQPQMSPEQRFKQIEILLSTAAKQINQNSEGIAELRNEMAQLTQRVNQNSAAITQLVELFTESIAVIRQMQTEVRGLQLENRRIIERVFREEEDS